MLETLSEEGHPDRLITANLIHSFIISESSPATLKNHLKGKD